MILNSLHLDDIRELSLKILKRLLENDFLQNHLIERGSNQISQTLIDIYCNNYEKSPEKLIIKDFLEFLE